MCDKGVYRCFFPFDFIPDQYETQEICNIVICLYPFLINLKKMYDEAVDDYLAVFKFIPDWFVISKMLEKLGNDLLTDDGILFYNKDFDKVIFIAN